MSPEVQHVGIRWNLVIGPQGFIWDLGFGHWDFPWANRFAASRSIRMIPQARQ